MNQSDSVATSNLASVGKSSLGEERMKCSHTVSSILTIRVVLMHKSEDGAAGRIDYISNQPVGDFDTWQHGLAMGRLEWIAFLWSLRSTSVVNVEVVNEHLLGEDK